MLFYLGSPDLGLMFANYAGYWLMGEALIAVGMLASLLTRNATIGFILGAAFCAALIVIGPAAGAVAPGLERTLQAVVMGTHFQDFAPGRHQPDRRDVLRRGRRRVPVSQRAGPLAPPLAGAGGRLPDVERTRPCAPSPSSWRC